MATPKYLECNLCGNQQPYKPFVPAICKKCDSQWLEARYDYDAFKREVLRGLPNRPNNMWRYQDVLPLADLDFLQFVRAAVREDLVEHLGQEQGIDDVALKLDFLDGGMGSSGLVHESPLLGERARNCACSL